jgi:threonine dehydratase
VLVPVGGGGLIAGIATALKALAPGARVVGVQAAAAPAAARSLAGAETVRVAPKPTIADGVAIAR